jgi:GT2 family glycosyltransferase
MKILINIAVFDTDQNKRTAYTITTYESLMKTVNFDTTEIVFIDNASCNKTKKFLKSIVSDKVHLITNESNEGTAMAINRGIYKYSTKDTYNIKCDNDITFDSYGWADEMVKCIETDKSIGILGLKRKDLPNQPSSKEYPTVIDFIPKHEIGEIWFKDKIMIEWCDDIIGSCTLFNPLLLDKIGYSWQPALYGFEDCLLCTRSTIAGFRNAFLPLIGINHIDIGTNPFTEWKRNQAHVYWDKFEEAKADFISGKRDIYYSPFE